MRSIKKTKWSEEVGRAQCFGLVHLFIWANEMGVTRLLSIHLCDLQSHNSQLGRFIRSKWVISLCDTIFVHKESHNHQLSTQKFALYPFCLSVCQAFKTSHIIGTMYARILKFYICIAYEKLAYPYFFSFIQIPYGGVMSLLRLWLFSKWKSCKQNI